MGGEQCSQGHRTNSRRRFYGFWVYTPMMELPSMPCSTLPVGKTDVEDKVASARRGDRKSREVQVSAVAGQCPLPGNSLSLKGSSASALLALASLSQLGIT